MISLLKSTILDNILAAAIKGVLVKMAENDEMPLDINDLCMATVMQEAKDSLAEDEDYKMNVLKSNLSEFLHGDNYSIEEQLEALLKADWDSLVDNVEGVEICERYEWSFTVLSLLEAVSYSQLIGK